MSVKQISVFLENKPGTLQHLTSVLASANINIRALSLADTKDFGIVRMLVNDVYAATTVLKDENFLASLTPVLVYAISDETGGLNKLLTKFAEANVNIEYMYAAPSADSEAKMLIKTDDSVKAQAALGEQA